MGNGFGADSTCRLVSNHRNQSFEEMSIAEWTEIFRNSVSDLPRVLGSGASYQTASQRLRALVRGGLVKLTDVRDNPGEKINPLNRFAWRSWSGALMADDPYLTPAGMLDGSSGCPSAALHHPFASFHVAPIMSESFNPHPSHP